MELSLPVQSVCAVKDSSTSKKRGRNEAVDESYIKNKKMLQEGFKSLTIHAESQPSILKEAQQLPSYGLYEIHQCPSHELFREEAECNSIDRIMSDDGQVENSNATTSPLRKIQNSLDSIISQSIDSDEDFFPGKLEEQDIVTMVAGGKRKYVTKVDYLVDELIRKNRKTKEILVYSSSDPESMLPSFVGPSPRTDHAISIIIPFSTNFCSLSKKQQFPLIEYSNDLSTPRQPVLLSGEVTHSDWGIEEVDGTAKYASVECNSLIPYIGSDHYSNIELNGGDAVVDDYESVMACCDDESSRGYSTNSSIVSCDSDMIVDSDDDDNLMAGSRRSIAFAESRRDTTKGSPLLSAAILQLKQY